MLSLQDSNSDKLNQNQMCYHYTKGQLFSSFWESDAKLQIFFIFGKTQANNLALFPRKIIFHTQIASKAYLQFLYMPENF